MGFYLSALIIGAIIQLIANPFLALQLEYRDYAITGYYASFNSLLSPFITFSLITFYSRNYYLLNKNVRRKLLNTIVTALVLFSALLSIISGLSLYFYFKINKVTLPFLPYAILCVGSCYFSNFYSLMLTELKMSRRAMTFFKLSMLNSILGAIFAILFVIVCRWGAFGKMLGTALTAFFLAVFCIKKLLTRWEFDKKLFYQALKFSWPLSLAAMLNYFFSGVDRAYLGRLNDNHALGLYNIGVQISGYMALLCTAINQTFQPDIYQSIANDQVKRATKILGAIALFNLLPIGIFIAFAPSIVNILTFGRFTEAANYAQILSLKNVTSAMYFGLSTIVVAYGFTKVTLFNKIVGAILCIFMYNWLIADYGFWGAAWGQVLSYFIMCLVCIFPLAYIITKKKAVL